MLVLSLFLLLSLAYARVEEAIEKLVYQRFGDSVKVQKVKVLGAREVSRVDRIELHMEYGKSNALAYLYSGEERYQVILDVLWKVKSFVALEDVPKGSLIRLEMFRVEERFMKSVPSDLRLNPEEFENFVASTKIPKGTVLRRSLLKDLPPVRAGDLVDAVYTSGSLEIKFKAIAVDSGQLGRTIRIKRDEKILRGKVVSRGKVEVLP
ncbi:MAG: flagellar basal body P-ring formation chaperone FlgA [Aquificaceae bacterium]|nr:flagellar basal body P-ring formation chaperone FlgA [Aquificaceae bacterium]MDW8066108.1 flagellar basal body P-ring formation chaperone FlgA [Aquificaceae bacterium]MDW8423440.1 flagellar basal body P-ring formation chaperone FlgA [Aquificaceae bacterium]